jgi:FtsP/CotA-like multicopper oxidase with cupredoxin domain
MRTKTNIVSRCDSGLRKVLFLALIVAGIAVAGAVNAAVVGVTGTNFQLTAKAGYIQGGDGATIYMWGYAPDGGTMQIPGPTLIVNEGEVITVTLSNDLNEPVSIFFPGQTDVTATGGSPGLLAQEAAASGGSVVYEFTASAPGTYQYHSGSNTALHVEMGLVGALIVNPATAGQAYDDPKTAFDEEYLFVFSEIDPAIHEAAEAGLPVDMTTRDPKYWLLNGRTAPDCLFPDGIPWLPSQPYGALAITSPGHNVLIRAVGAGSDIHPMHYHGANYRVIARDGRMHESEPGVSGADAGEEDNTMNIAAGQTIDAIWTWTNDELGWDVFGHSPSDPCESTKEICDTNNPLYAHGKPLPVALPQQQFMTFGGFWSGSPFLGEEDVMPPGEGGLNVAGGFFHIWHSHTEKELCNYDIFPGGILTFVIVLPPN